ncbi:MAG: hypothetical protein VR72_09055 [Clostridiaceae bacterium BRH_c20a]|nr:MAG: hypothetical protein VR72_09055 [Clostridiaceae bacterium BRH_c20a]
MEKCLKIVFPINTSEKLLVPIEGKILLITVFKRLTSQMTFFFDFMKNGGNTDEGSILMIFNGEHICFNDLEYIFVNPGDELYFIPPILGG